MGTFRTDILPFRVLELHHRASCPSTTVNSVASHEAGCGFTISPTPTNHNLTVGSYLRHVIEMYAYLV
jgi:hypothetical protein